MVWTVFAASFAGTLPLVGAAGAGSCAQSGGHELKPQKFSGRSRRAASCQADRSEASGWQLMTFAVVSRPSLLWKCRSTPASSFTGDFMAHPCALTTSVSQTSEKRVPGSRLVTRIGTLIGTLELRRSPAEEFTFCIVTGLRARDVRTLRLKAALPTWITLPLSRRDSFVSGVLSSTAERPMRSRTLVTTALRASLPTGSPPKALPYKP